MKENNKKTIFDFAGKYKYFTYVGCVFSGISSVLILVPFICIWKMAYEIIKVYPAVQNVSDISRYGWTAVLFSILGIIVYVAALMCTHKAAFRTAKNMRSEALHHMVNLPLGYFNENGSGKLRRIINESAGQTETYLAHMLPDIVGAVVTPAAMIIILFVFDWRLGILSLIPMIIGLYFCKQMMGKELAESMKQYQNSLETMNNEAVEYIRGIPVVKTFGQTIFSFKSFYKVIMDYKKWTVDYTIRLRKSMCGFTVSINGIFALLIPTGVLLAASAKDPHRFLSDFIFYVIFTPIITVAMNKIMFSSENVMLAKDATNRINSILEEKPLRETNNNMIPKNFDIEFSNVNFAYKNSDSNALNSLSFKVSEGETIGIVGASGGGKSTAVSLIPRFYDVDSGSIKIGGVDVRNIKSENLMNMVSFVFQNTKLFKMSLLENIRFSKPDATREEVIKAARAAQCQDIFDKMPDGIDTVVGTKGVYLSGGEAQRIALARAILKDAPIVLLDEATAFADPENEYMIQKAFEFLTKGKTVIMIAHRLSTIRNADKIFVISDGCVTESGTHEELLDEKGEYFGMWNDYETAVSWKVKEVV